MTLKFEYDESLGLIRCNGREIDFSNPEAFELISRAWHVLAGTQNMSTV